MISLSQYDQRDLLAICLLLLGSILRLYGFSEWSLTNDELSTLFRSQYPSFLEVIEKGVRPDVHPAFVEVFMHFWGKLFGYSVFAFRLPFILFSIGGLIYFYQLAKVWLNKNAALIALSLIVCSQLFVLYAQIGRAYSMGLFFTLMFSFHWFKIINNKFKNTDLVLMVIAGILGLFTHYFVGLSLSILMLFGLFIIPKKLFVKYLVSLLTIGILFLPHLSITLDHLKKGGVQWLPEPGGDYIFLFLEFLFNYSEFFYTALILIPVVAILNKSFRLFSKKQALILSLFVIPYLVAYFYSIHRSPVLQFSVLIFCSPFLLLSISSFVTDKLKFKGILLIVLLIVSTGMYSLIHEKNYYSAKRFADFKSVAELSVKWTNKIGQDRVLSISNANSSNYLNFYTSKKDSTFSYNVSTFDKVTDVAEARDLIERTDLDYVLIAFANVPVPAEVHEFTKQYFPEVVKQQKFFNSQVILYKKSEKKRPYSFKSHYLDQSKNWNFKATDLQDSIFISNSMAYQLNESTEYALTYKDTIKNILPNNSKYLSISAWLKSEDTTNVKLVCSIKRNGETIYWRGVDTSPFYSKNEWHQFMYVLKKNEQIDDSDQIAIFFWNTEKQKMFIDDFEMTNFVDSDFNYYDY